MVKSNDDNDQVVYEPVDSAEDSFYVMWRGQEIAALDKLDLGGQWLVSWWSLTTDDEEVHEFEREFSTKVEAQSFIATHILDLADGLEVD